MWRRILKNKIQNSFLEKGFRNPPAGGVWGGMRAGNQPRQGESIPPDKLFRPAESFLLVLIIWILLEIVSNFVQQTPHMKTKRPLRPFCFHLWVEETGRESRSVVVVSRQTPRGGVATFARRRLRKKL